jgi:SAM-dependent methyltransferase
MPDTEHEFEDREYVRRWAQGADERRPARKPMFQHIAAIIAGLPATSPRLVELGCGPGTLAEVLLERMPALQYDGFDLSPVMLELAHERIDRFGARARLHAADLRGDEWLGRIDGAPDAVVTNQALHDLGSEAAVAASYRRAHALLKRGGVFVNAELVIDDGAPAKPGKLPVTRHLELLRDCGYEDVHTELAIEEYVCFVARRGA